MLIGDTIEIDIEKVRKGFKIYANDSWWYIVEIKVFGKNIYEFTVESPFSGKVKFSIDKLEFPKVWVRKF